ncbi:MAG TPA: methyltransferase type 11 [Cyanobacteria bacterium UBA11149]|nr:methyltransferase type 11 [Cyanobacteria bacterium UBA11367]HBE60126.1 methyltransferase type 11 [Cyanobacteria bacterium UBA11366]HBK62703.1 methyltransferase type 11 [Cyanobacteria bacterium UBA11166]HBR72557.1 methyltransferase type 11 [Cyanobacteria bacterium UBA11159]HBS71654.1 methyltransferase type 11 [Cyanobacteria bacterium UBA11153]HBW90168.1 methyltransferase type 11 [Cyanobacteria bacterium UBA11149]HCA97739.1 methyltransferase type 11 [Cyanobacteria bacterium UBA9226]
MLKFFGNIVDHRRDDSLATTMRKKRFALFKSLLASIPGSLKILDVGGRPNIWKQSGFLSEFEHIDIVIMNIEKIQVTELRMTSIIDDATNMKYVSDLEFDVVFSNSVIEHVGDYQKQQNMANEIKRVGKRYFVQTPNLYFPIEPHFLFPLFQFLPLPVKIWLITHFKLGWRGPVKDRQKALATVTEIRLLSKKEFVALFPEAKIVEEKFLGLTKSFIAYYGWDTP